MIAVLSIFRVKNSVRLTKTNKYHASRLKKNGQIQFTNVNQIVDITIFIFATGSSKFLAIFERQVRIQVGVGLHFEAP